MSGGGIGAWGFMSLELLSFGLVLFGLVALDLASLGLMSLDFVVVDNLALEGMAWGAWCHASSRGRAWHWWMWGRWTRWGLLRVRVKVQWHDDDAVVHWEHRPGRASPPPS